MKPAFEIKSARTDALAVYLHDADSTALDAALAEHKARIKACKLGQGPNRHLLGLKLMAAKAGGELPEFYKDEGY